MDIIKAIQMAQKKQVERKYESLYWCIDVHGVILTPTYNLNNSGAVFYPYALDTMRLLSKDIKNKIILWTSSYDDSIWHVVDSLNHEGIRIEYINENPDFVQTSLCDFTKKFYFDILLDDKAGFDGETDWKIIYEYLSSII